MAENTTTSDPHVSRLQQLREIIKNRGMFNLSDTSSSDILWPECGYRSADILEALFKNISQSNPELKRFCLRSEYKRMCYRSLNPRPGILGENDEAYLNTFLNECLAMASGETPYRDGILCGQIDYKTSKDGKYQPIFSTQIDAERYLAKKSYTHSGTKQIVRQISGRWEIYSYIPLSYRVKEFANSLIEGTAKVLFWLIFIIITGSLLNMCGFNSTDCYTEWDGRGNSRYCD